MGTVPKYLFVFCDSLFSEIIEMEFIVLLNNSEDNNPPIGIGKR